MPRSAVAPVCKICGGADQEVLYQGPIRLGRFGQWSQEPQTVWRCRGCGSGYLPSAPVDYESGAYRALVDGGGTLEEWSA